MKKSLTYFVKGLTLKGDIGIIGKLSRDGGARLTAPEEA